MATPRSPSFYSSFFRAVRSCEPTTYRSIKLRPASVRHEKLRVTGRRSQSTYQNRYGPAATDHLPPPPKPSDAGASKPAETKPDSQAEAVKEQSKEAQPAEQDDDKVSEDLNPRPKSEGIPEDVVQSSPPPNNGEPEAGGRVSQPELDMVLSIPSPSEVKENGHRHPHLEASPYEHHFDTYSLVQELAKETDAFTDVQAITLMKAVRLMLANNLDMAKEGLVSKSDIENENYLFRAACSELRTTLQSSRFAENQRQRSTRASLQHEHDILNQKVNQDILAMREELKGMFNDRKLGLQEEKRKIDTQISELNYQITVTLNSEAKSEVESLRWVLTRRAAMAIGAAAFMVLSALQLYSIKSREQAEVEKKRQAAQKRQEELMSATDAARFTTPSRSAGTQTGTSTETSVGTGSEGEFVGEGSLG